MKERKMCDRTKTAIDVIKSQHRKTLTKEETLMLFEKVIEDNEKIVKRVESLEGKVDAGFAEIKELLTKKKNFWEKIPILKEIPLPVWLILWTVVLITGALLGVNPDFIQYIKTGG